MMAVSSISSSSCFTSSAAIRHPSLLSHKNLIHKSSFSLNGKRLGTGLQNNFNFCVKVSQKRNLEAVGVPTSVPVRVAHELLQAGHKYLDVRTPGEFSAGHAPGAVNIPYLYKVGSGMSKNPEFLKEVSSHFRKHDEIIVGCQLGKRSMMAATDLVAAGFTGITDIAGGYANMGTTRKWFRTIRRKLVGSSNRDIVVVHTNTTPSTHDESAWYEKIHGIASSSSSFVASSPSAFERRIFTKEDTAAIRLQAFFRGHLVHYPNFFALMDDNCDDLNNLTGQASVSSTEEPGEAAGVGSWGVCAETGTYSSVLHALDGPVAGQGSCTAAPQRGLLTADPSQVNQCLLNKSSDV
ncbi:hypothetical protein DVH24_029674 [Malus domestica]|uniref:Rhodanese domain-containing protein n=1 Tax=Malus domestica TaxID=3750 RepID=A0A498I1G8_MALDO|nr:hypothetical protein DVH24_029674 [Malus domestica]